MTHTKRLIAAIHDHLGLKVVRIERQYNAHAMRHDIFVSRWSAYLDDYNYLPCLDTMGHCVRMLKQGWRFKLVRYGPNREPHLEMEPPAS